MRGLAKEPDGLSVSGALEKARALTELTGTKHITGIMLDIDFVFRDSKGLEVQDNRDEAFAATLGSRKASVDVAEVGVWSQWVQQSI